MARRVCVDLVSFVGGHVFGRLHEPRSERDRLLMRAGEIIDVKVEMDLLCVAIWPVRWDVIRGELYPHHPAIVRVEDIVVGFGSGVTTRSPSSSLTSTE